MRFPPSRRGFSLVELLLALAIVAIVGGIVFVDYSGATVRERLKGASRKLAGYCEMIRSQSISKGTTCRLEIDFDKARFRYVIDPPRDAYGRFVEPGSDSETPRPLDPEEIDLWDESFEWDDFPRDVFPVRLVISAKEFYDKSTVSWPFWPDGTVAPFVLILSTSQGHVASVSMNGLTGTASAEPDVTLGFPEAQSGDFSSIMGNRAPGSGQKQDASSGDPGTSGDGGAGRAGGGASGGRTK